eukprot:scaffold102993_cov19-Tisochrysis_lutea.AAC.1
MPGHKKNQAIRRQEAIRRAAQDKLSSCVARSKSHSLGRIAAAASPSRSCSFSAPSGCGASNAHAAACSRVTRAHGREASCGLACRHGQSSSQRG